MSCVAGWLLGYLGLPKTWMPLLYPVIGLAPHFVYLFGLPAVLIVLFIGVGRAGWIDDSPRFAAIAAIAIYLVLSDPLLVVIFGLALLVYGAAGLTLAEFRAELSRKLLVVAIVAALFLASGTHSFLLGIAEFSVPRFFGVELARMQGLTQFASIAIHGSPFSIVGRSAIILSTIEVGWLAIYAAGRTRWNAVGHPVATSIIDLGGWVAVTGLQRWPGLSMLCFEYSVRPFYTIYACAFLGRTLAWMPSALGSAFSLVERSFAQSTTGKIGLLQIPILCCALRLQYRAAPVASQFVPYPPAATYLDRMLVDHVGAVPRAAIRGRLATFT